MADVSVADVSLSEGERRADVASPFILDVGILQVDVAGREDPLLTHKNKH